MTTPASDQDTVLATARGVLDVEIQALEDLRGRLGAAFVEAICLLEESKGRVIVTGMGKSGHVGKKMAATFSSTGTPAYFLHPAEGSHGDLGMLMPDDIVIAISNSGETPEILNILPVVKRLGLKLIAITANTDSTLSQQSDITLSIAVQQEACPLNLAPTASTTATLALGDTLAVVLLERKGFTREDFAVFHPAGALGKRLLLRVEDLMHSGEALPLVTLDTPFLNALLEISSKKLGMAIVVDSNGVVQGVLTDGDVRRALTHQVDVTKIELKAVMTLSPKTIGASDLAVAALRKMEDHKITVLLITNANGQPEGVIHLHDILKTGIS